MGSEAVNDAKATKGQRQNMVVNSSCHVTARREKSKKLYRQALDK